MPVICSFCPLNIPLSTGTSIRNEDTAARRKARERIAAGARFVGRVSVYFLYFKVAFLVSC